MTEKPKKKQRREPAKSGNSTGNPPENGRPHKIIDGELFERLCQSMCTYEEIEAMMKTDLDTLHTWCKRELKMSFSDAYKRFSNGGRASLRRTQLRLAQKNAAMAIWCGKQYLGQVDHDKNNSEQISQAAIALIGAANMLSEGDTVAESSQPETD